MKNIGSGLSRLRVVRFVIVAFACTVLLLSNTLPASAIGSPKSNPDESTTQLLETQKKTDEISKEPPPTLEKVQKESNKGLNEIQGDADIDKQKRPENTQGSTSVEDEIKGFLDKVTGND
ncbi:hypothetical protein [Iningainema tapete]|uniref:Low temperature-induced protein n=1 Tax=Iningainema tapete BLCC-T55 TaxID=2748662 RepID=A0A8J6XJP9_9CYAN|nr:hypothetical protein [Iningainema tapete]MBD2771592.1 hypothetical protein [Iningainema tapete BLCC-T55]